MSHVAGHIIIQRQRSAENEGLEYSIDFPIDSDDTPEQTAKKLEKILRKLKQMDTGDDG